jgi:hypothetical protein
VPGARSRESHHCTLSTLGTLGTLSTPGTLGTCSTLLTPSPYKKKAGDP